MIIIIFSISVAVTIIIIWGFVQFNIFQIRVQLGTNFMVWGRFCGTRLSNIKEEKEK